MQKSVYGMLAWYQSYNLAERTREWLTRDRGASAVEYTLLLAAIAGAIALMIFTLGGRIVGLFTTACENIKGPGSTTC